MKEIIGGGGGRIARAEKKVDKAKANFSKVEGKMMSKTRKGSSCKVR